MLLVISTFLALLRFFDSSFLRCEIFLVHLILELGFLSLLVLHFSNFIFYMQCPIMKPTLCDIGNL